VQKWINKAKAVAEDEGVKAHEKRAKRLESQAEAEKNLWNQALLRKQAQAERRASSVLPPLKEPAPPSTSIPMPVPQPTVITNCDTAGCWENVGNRYNKAAGDRYFRGDGKACQGVGGSMNCN
jgi:hypothetical protein